MRYFNVFGPRQDPRGAYAAVIPKFINQLLKLESPTINGDGLHSRDFTYIDNIIQRCDTQKLITGSEYFLNLQLNQLKSKYNKKRSQI